MNDLEYTQWFDTLLLNYNINKDTDVLIIWSSGWPDSMFLTEMAHKNNYNIVVVHFNHKLRWQDSDNDESFLNIYCKNKNIIFHTESCDIHKYSMDTWLSIEEAARNKRYEFLEKIRYMHNAKYILIWHHLDDSIETTIFNLARWTKLSGLTWINKENWYILRPLSQLTKSEILEYLHNNNIEYCIDKTNFESVYHRNIIRNNILPEFEKINKDYRKNIGNFMNYMSEMKEFVDNQVYNFLWRSNAFSITEFNSLSKFIQKEIVRVMFFETNNNTIWLNEWNVNEIIRFIQNEWNNWNYGKVKVKTIKNLYIEKCKDQILFLPQK